MGGHGSKLGGCRQGGGMGGLPILARGVHRGKGAACGGWGRGWSSSWADGRAGGLVGGSDRSGRVLAGFWRQGFGRVLAGLTALLLLCCKGHLIASLHFTNKNTVFNFHHPSPLPPRLCNSAFPGPSSHLLSLNYSFLLNGKQESS